MAIWVEAAIAEHDPDLLLWTSCCPAKMVVHLPRPARPGFTRPIILLTSVGSDMNQVLGLELGANDYVIKTTPPAVLLARIPPNCASTRRKAALPRRARPPPRRANILHFGRLVVGRQRATSNWTATA